MTNKAGEQPTITQALWHSENVEDGIWSATFYFGKGDDACKAMRQFCDDHRTPSLAAQEVDSGMSGDAVERAEWFWANLPTGRKWTGLATHEKALVCHQIARIAPTLAAQDGLVEARLREAIELAITQRALDIIRGEATTEMANVLEQYAEVATFAALSAIKGDKS